jgi:hypothetical protein
MPKSVDVEDFAAKLALLAKRLNWSRAKLAQQVGVDKSLAVRWLNGNSRPSSNSLMLLTMAAAHHVEGLTAADWDRTPNEFARRLGIEPAAQPEQPAKSPGRLTISGLRNPPASIWSAAYVGLWAGFYQSLTNRGIIRLMAATFAVDDDGLRFAFTDGSFSSEAAAVATQKHVQCIGEVTPLDNHLIFVTFHTKAYLQGAAVIDGLVSAFGPDDTVTATPMVLFRIDDEAGVTPPSLQSVMQLAADGNRRVESEAAQTGDPLAGLRDIAPADFLQSLFLRVGAPRPDGQIDHLMRIPSKRSLALDRRAMDELPADSPLRIAAANLRRLFRPAMPEQTRPEHKR